MQCDDLNVTGVRRAPHVDRRTKQREGAEGIYGTVSSLDMLPAGAQKHLALGYTNSHPAFLRCSASRPS